MSVTYTTVHGNARILNPLSEASFRTQVLIDTSQILFVCVCVCVCLFAFSRAALAAYGGSQAKGRIGAVATSLCQSHSNAGSELRLQPTPQLIATPDS